MNNPINLFQYDIDNFLKKYTRFLSKNIYIDNKTYANFMQEYNYLFKKIEQEKFLYQTTPGYKKIEKLQQEEKQLLKYHNQKYLNNNKLNTISINNLLDKTQKNIITTFEPQLVYLNNKNNVPFIINKIKYLIKNKTYLEENILIITNSQADNTTIQKELAKNNLKIKCHSLKEIQEKYLIEEEKKITPALKYNIFKNYLQETIFQNKELLKKLYTTFQDYIYLNQDCLEFETFKDYHSYLYKRMFLQSKLSKKKFNEREIIKRKNNLRTILNESMPTKVEVDIANFLYLNCINYHYQFHTFTLENKTKIIYQKKIESKEENTIDLSQNQQKEKTIEILTYELIKRRCPFEKREEEEIYQELKNTTQDSYFIDFINKILIPLTTINNLSKTNFTKEQKELLKIILDNYQNEKKKKNMVEERTLNERINKVLNKNTYPIFLDITSIIPKNNYLIILSKKEENIFFKMNLSLQLEYQKYLTENKRLCFKNTYLSLKELETLTNTFLKENLNVINNLILKKKKALKVFLINKSSIAAKTNNLKMILTSSPINPLIAVTDEKEQKQFFQEFNVDKLDKSHFQIENRTYQIENIFTKKTSYPIIFLPYFYQKEEELFSKNESTYQKKLLLLSAMMIAKKEIWILCPKEKEKEVHLLLNYFS